MMFVPAGGFMRACQFVGGCRLNGDERRKLSRSSGASGSLLLAPAGAARVMRRLPPQRLPLIV